MVGPDSLTCPNCETPIGTSGQEACSGCGMRLTGRDASRLWMVRQSINTLSQEIDTLTKESDELIARLLTQAPNASPATELPDWAPPTGEELVGLGVPQVTGYPGVVEPQRAVPRPTPAPAAGGPSGQQLLLGLGALMLLSAASLFLIWAWHHFGVVGQSLIMVAFTTLAVLGSGYAARRNLSSTAESAGIIATGLLVLDLLGAYRFNLFGFGDLDTDVYWAGATLVGAAALLGFDLARAHLAGASGVMVRTYRPAAASLVAFTPWLLLSILEVTQVANQVAMLVLSLVLGAVTVVVFRYDTDRASGDEPAPPFRGPWSVLPLGFSTGLLFLGYLLQGLDLGFDLDRDMVVRYQAFGLLILLPLMLGVLSLNQVATRAHLNPAWMPRLPAITLSVSAVLLLIPTLDITYPWLIVIAWVFAAAAVVAHGGWVTEKVPMIWRKPLAIAVHAAQPALVLLVWVITRAGEHNLGDLFQWNTMALQAYPSVGVIAIPALLWFATSAFAAYRHRSEVWCYTAQAASIVTTAILCRDIDLESLRFVSVLLGVALINSVLVLGSRGFRAPEKDSYEMDRDLGLWFTAIVAFVLHMITGLNIAYDFTLQAIPRTLSLAYATDPTSTVFTISDRYLAFLLLLIAPVFLAVASTKYGSKVGIAEQVREFMPVLATGAFGLVFVTPILDTPYSYLVALSGALAGLALWFHLDRFPKHPALTYWRRPLAGFVFIAQPFLAFTVWGITSLDGWTVKQLALDPAGLMEQHPNAPLFVMLLPTLLWAASSFVGAAKNKIALWGFVTQIATVLGVLLLQQEASDKVTLTALFLLTVVGTVVACVAARKQPPPANDEPKSEIAAMEFWGIMEFLAGLVMVGWGSVNAIQVASHFDAPIYALSYALPGIMFLIYAASPRRLLFAYAGSILLTIADAILCSDAGIETIEAYTMPLVVLLAGIGFVQWSRNKNLPSRLTMGPALSVGLLPSLLAAVSEGNPWRLAFVTGAGFLVLALGVTKHLKAPVAAGTLVLLVIAITQGGDLLLALPAWLIIGGGGAAALALGANIERAVKARRRLATTWKTLK